MACAICELRNIKIKDEIEGHLNKTSGYLSPKDKDEIKQFITDLKLREEETNKYIQIVDKLTDQECQLHWNFHQSSSFQPCSIVEEADVTNPEEKKGGSIKNDVGKDEAFIVYDLMAKQMETFNCLTKKINNVLNDSELDLTCAVVNPVTLDFYKTLTKDIRDNVKTLRELDQAVNGEKSGSLEGLKAIAVALSSPLPGNSQNTAVAGVQVGAKDLTTDEYDY